MFSAVGFLIRREVAICTRTLFLLLLLGIPTRGAAQDLFEIQVYSYETVAPRHTMLELHLNTIPLGTREGEMGTFPNHRQSHFTLEVTHGLTEHWELGCYLVSAYVPDNGMEFAGARLRPRFRIPESWGLPLRVGLSTEFGFNKSGFDPNGVTLELRPIIEKEAGRFYFSANPTFSKSLRGPDAHRGFEFEPGVKVAWHLTRRLEPGLEYYGGTGFLTRSDPMSGQRHMIFPTLDLDLSDDWELNFGIGRGLTGGSERWVLKMIIGRRIRI